MEYNLGKVREMRPSYGRNVAVVAILAAYAAGILISIAIPIAVITVIVHFACKWW